MDREQRQAFNAAFSEERHRQMLGVIEREAGFPADFRISETPLFLDAETTRDFVRAGWEIARAVTDPAYLTQSDRALPPGLSVPGQNAHTTFLQVDFALALDENGHARAAPDRAPGLSLALRLPVAHRASLPRDLRASRSTSPPTSTAWTKKPTATACATSSSPDADPETVILLEVEPEKQKTRVDFACTERIIGVPTVGLAEVIERGDRLYYHRDGRDVPITRIYNRVIFDELERKGLPQGLFQREHEGVAWVGHPNWYFRISKFSLPFLKSQYAPPCRFSQ